MKLLITGICGFVGSVLARALREVPGVTEIAGVDNLSRAGSRVNLEPLRAEGLRVDVGDIRDRSYWEQAPALDWVIDAAAEPSVLAGVDGKTGSLELVENNLYGTVNILEYCKRVGAGFLLLSTSRVYSIGALTSLEVRSDGPSVGRSDGLPVGRFIPVGDQNFPAGISPAGVAEDASTAPPVSLYGSTKVASEHLALEYGATFGFPVWINRCGVLAGAGQFGIPTQGIFSFWLHSWMHRRPLKYIGFGGGGLQVRDCLHPADLVPVLHRQMRDPACAERRVFNLAGGAEQAMSLAELSAWCERRWGAHAVAADPEPRPFDLPWVVLDARRAQEQLGFRVVRGLEEILEEIADFAEAHPEWLDLSQGKAP